MTLTILMEQQDEDTYVMPSENGWCIYAHLSEERGSSQGLADAVRRAVEPSMAERAWNGEDMTMSATALPQAVKAMTEAAADYIFENCPPDIYSENTGLEEREASDTEASHTAVPETVAQEAEVPETETSEQDNVQMQYVFDISDLLSYEEWKELESRAGTISQRHHCGVYFILLDDYTEYGYGDVFDVTTQIYHSMEFGMGDGRDGIIVLLSMNERDYAMFVYGDNAGYAFDEYGQVCLEEADAVGNSEKEAAQ